MNDFIKKHESEFNGVVDHFKKELGSIRAGRANPAMIEEVLVESYGAKTPLKQLGRISVTEARCMSVQPLDKNLIKDIEKAIIYANLGLAVSAESTLVRVTVPQMTEENRKDLVKIMNEKLEAAKVSARAVREKTKEEITTAFTGKQITEDDKFDFLKELDEKIGGINKNLQDLAIAKENEIMSV